AAGGGFGASGGGESDRAERQVHLQDGKRRGSAGLPVPSHEDEGVLIPRLVGNIGPPAYAGGPSFCLRRVASGWISISSPKPRAMTLRIRLGNASSLSRAIGTQRIPSGAAVRLATAAV